MEQNSSDAWLGPAHFMRSNNIIMLNRGHKKQVCNLLHLDQIGIGLRNLFTIECFHQVGVETGLSHQSAMSAALDDRSTVQHQNLV